MGYMTEYRIRVNYDQGVDPEATGEALLKRISEIPELKKIGLIPDELPFELAHCCGHWYDYEHHMKMIAREFPGCTLTIHGKGEEDDDEWENEFKGNSMRYRAIAIRWGDWSKVFEGKYEPAYYTLYADIPNNEKLAEVYSCIIEWMNSDRPDWKQIFDLNLDRAARVLESNGAVEWYGYAQMHDLADAFPNCTFELRCVPVRKGPEYEYRICGNDERFRKNELRWIDWSTWR